MRTMILLSLCILFGAAACGGPEATAAQQLAAPAATAATSGSTGDASCTPVDSCDPDRPLFCSRSTTDCYFLYPSQQTVPVSCLARPTPKPSRHCP